MAFAASLLLISVPGLGAAQEDDDSPGDADRAVAIGDAYDAAVPAERSLGWSVHVDNDLFAFTDRDRDYTAGFSFSLGGRAARDRAPRFFSALQRFDAALARGSLAPRGSDAGYGLEAGVLLFTPQDLAASEPLFDDRPYASLFYVSSTRLSEDTERGVAYQSSLTLGLLGLPLAGALHRSVHDAFGNVAPEGYSHQISDGGEPTFRYAVSRYGLLASGTYRERPYSVRLDTGASVGYVTEVSSEVSARWGRPRLPWWSTPPASSDYAGHPAVGEPRTSGGDGPTVMLEAGAKARLRLYNAFLEGQFRDSDVTYSFDDVHHLLLEAWVGVTTVLKNGLSVSYTLRHQTDELEARDGSRGFTWAGITFSQQL